jgi:hypothetical protein
VKLAQSCNAAIDSGTLENAAVCRCRASLQRCLKAQFVTIPQYEESNIEWAEGDADTARTLLFVSRVSREHEQRHVRIVICAQ